MTDKVSPDTTVTKSIFNQLIALYDNIESIKVKPEHARVAIFAHGWYSRIRQTARAVILLSETGYDSEASPLRRSLIEHTVALNWLVQAGDDAVNSILRSYQDRTRRIRESSLGDEPAEVSDAFDYILNTNIDKSSEDRHIAFKHCCEKYGAPYFYIGYLLETARSHPSFTTVEDFTRAVDSDAGTILLASPKESPFESKLLVTGLLALSTRAFNSLLVDTPWSHILDEVERIIQPRSSA